MKTWSLFGALVSSLLFTAFGYAVTIDTVPIGNPGNPGDTRYDPTGVGSVGYGFRMARTEVTNAQYVEFLNAVAGADSYGVFFATGVQETLQGIVRSGSPGSYNYSVKPAALGGTYTYGDKPVAFVSSGDAMRFVNWLHNGQPAGAQNASTTEDGEYTLNGATSSAALAAITRNAGARWWFPSIQEWYKAAYHKNDGVTGNYWDYPTATNIDPNNNLPTSDTGNSVNYWNGTFTTGNFDYPLTDAGAYMLSASPYGTFDMGGNLAEWTEDAYLDSDLGFVRRVSGGSWGSSSIFPTFQLRAQYSGGGLVDPSAHRAIVGFRVASSVPEPATLYLGGMAVVGIWRRRRRN